MTSSRHRRSPGPPARHLRTVGLLGLSIPMISLAIGVAQAQTTTTASGPGTCSGSLVGGDGNMHNISGNVYLLANGKQITPTSGSAGGIFNLAECQCATNDIDLRVIMSPSGVAPQGAPQPALMYFGNTDCSSNTVNTNPADVCELITSSPLNYSAFQVSQPPVDIPLPADILSYPLSPQQKADNPARSCAALDVSNVITVTLGPTSAPAECSLNVAVDTIPPTIGGTPTLQPGNGALTVNWSVPENTGIQYFQVLCQDVSGADAAACPLPVYNLSNSLYYSVCIDGTIYRRFDLPGLNGATASPNGDGGTTVDLLTTLSTGGGAVAKSAAVRRRFTPIVPLVNPDMSMPADMNMSVDMSASLDMSVSPPDLNGDDLLGDDLAPAPPADMRNSDFENLDPRFLCSQNILSSGLSTSYRVGGLCNGHTYNIKVVAIDVNGNPAGFTTVSGTPTPTENLIEALYQDGNSASGFGCAATGTPSLPRSVGNLLPLLALLWLRRRRNGTVTGQLNGPAQKTPCEVR